MRRSIKFLALAALTATPCALAQQPAAAPQDERPGTRVEVGVDRARTPAATRRDGAADNRNADGQQQLRDKELAYWLMVDNSLEVAAAKIALEKTKDESIRNFAQHMHDQHNQYLRKLEQFTGVSAPTVDEAQGRNTDRRGTEANAPAREGAQVNVGNGRVEVGVSPAASEQALDLMTLKRELGDQCLSSAKKELSDKSGRDFDKCYIDHQVMAHQMMLDTLTVFENHASPQLRDVINEGITTTKEHLKDAKEICKRYDAGATKTAVTERQ